MDFEYGSYWRKWDLHVHTPMSVLCNNYVMSDEEKSSLSNILGIYDIDDLKMYNFMKKLFNKAIEQNIVAIGITDYFFLDGYKFIKNVLKDKEKLELIFQEEIKKDTKFLDKVEEILVLPNVEFRTNVVQDKSKLQIHAIFSDELDGDVIEQNFINCLKFQATSEQQSLTKNNVIDYGKMCRNSEIGGKGSDLLVGMNSISINLNDLRELSEKKQFKDKVILVLADEDISKMSWGSQVGGIRQSYYSVCDAMFTSNVSSIQWCKGKDCIETIGKQLPCLWGSDAHDYTNLFVVQNQKYCWIKADVTFSGLKYALFRFNNRVFIGALPDELDSFNKRMSNTIKELQVTKNTDCQEHTWFNSIIKFSPFMSTIIGNKGSGKSAITDILGYLGNSRNMKYASFLNENRFLSKATNYGSYYKAILSFLSRGKDSDIKKENLLVAPNEYCIEELRYLPQSYIEDICNNLDGKFQDEINDAIFSFIPEPERLGTNSLSELIRKKTEYIDTKLFNLYTKLKEKNDEIIYLEEKSTERSKKEVENKLDYFNKKLEQHLANKPVEVKRPDNFSDGNSGKIIEYLNQKKDQLNSEIERYNNSLKHINNRLSQIVNFKAKETELINNINLLNEEYNTLAAVLQIDKQKYIDINIYNAPLNNCYEALSREQRELRTQLIKMDSEDELLDIEKISKDQIEELLNSNQTLMSKLSNIDGLISKISKKMTDVQKLYVDYQKKQEDWEKYKLMLLGEKENTIDGTSIRKLNIELEYLKEKLPIELSLKKQERLNVVKDIIKNKFEKKGVLEHIYSPIQDMIESVDELKNSNISFISSIKVNKNEFIETISKHIDLRRNSKLKDTKVIKDRIDSTDFQNTTSVLKFVEFIYSLSTDNIDEISRLIYDRKSFNNYIGEMNYIEPKFMISADGKMLNELSPGGRGIVLLIFYLALSNENTPLIIDQPEDNLDNQSIFTKLVPAIIEAKKKRQIIVVTHNPNIAIACDSETIIYCSQGNNGRSLNYSTGSIENKNINQKIVDILEGTLPAFDIRKDTYNKA